MEGLNQIEIDVPGELSLFVALQRPDAETLEVKGKLAFSLTHSVEAALQFLPFGMGKSLSNNMIFKYLDGDTYYFKLKGLMEVEVKVNAQGLMRLKAHYFSPLAKPVTLKETERIFRHFSQELVKQGIQPENHEVMEPFLASFKRSSRGELDFAALFRGRSLEHPEMPKHIMDRFEIFTTHVQQDRLGDLEVTFEAQGHLDLG